MGAPQRRSPLHDRTALRAPDGKAGLEERKFLGKLILRGAHDQVQAAVKEVLGLDLPRTSPKTASGDKADILWLSPDEWMIVTEPDAERAVAASLGEALAGVHHQIADVSDYYTTICLSGAAAREILMKLTMLDVHRRSFKTGEVRGTMLMHSQATLYQRVDDDAEAGPGFDIFVRWSMADYLWCLIAECGREFGLPAQKPVTGERLVI